MTKQCIYTGGTFDILHPGHIDFLEFCRMYGDVTVSLNTDEFITSYKGQPPYQSYQHRKRVLEGLSSVKGVIPNTGGSDSSSAIDYWLQYCVGGDFTRFLAIGSDWAYPRDYLAQMGLTWEWLLHRSISLLFIPRPDDGPSSTKVKAAMNDWENR